MVAQYLSTTMRLARPLFLVTLCQPFSASAETVASDIQASYDQVIAKIPFNRAATAAVALAELNIAMHKAKKNAEQTLCHGNWSPTGETRQEVGPLVVKLNADQKIWLYRSLRRAHPLVCPRISRAQFFLEVSRHLPAWVSIRPAGQARVFNQGSVQPLPVSHLVLP
jgi:hypothetical protein